MTTDTISHVSSVTRTVPAKLRRWLEATYPVCGRQACDNSRNLILDHIEPFADGGILSRHNAWRLCPRGDDLKTHRGWVVVGSPGHWDLVPPRHPAVNRQGAQPSTDPQFSPSERQR